MTFTYITSYYLCVLKIVIVYTKQHNGINKTYNRKCIAGLLQNDNVSKVNAFTVSEKKVKLTMSILSSEKRSIFFRFMVSFKYHMFINFLHSIHEFIFTFSKQSFNEFLDFCNRSWPHELHKFDLQLPSIKHRTYLPEVILVLWLTASHTWVASLLLAPLAVKVHAGCFAFMFYTPKKKTIIWLHIKYKTVFFQNYE